MKGFPIGGDQAGDSIGVPPLNSCPVEELGITVSLLEPSDARLLLPEDLFLFLSGC